MAYTDVISLAEAKLHLRVDDTLTDDDAQITRMIETACRFVENWTNHILDAVTKTYQVPRDCVRVYDYPINTADDDASLDGIDIETKYLYKVYTPGTAPTSIDLNVGYTTASNVPRGLVDVALEVIELLYYGPETGKTVSKDLSPLAVQTLNQYKRFVL